MFLPLCLLISFVNFSINPPTTSSTFSPSLNETVQCVIYRYILVEIHWSLIILHREQFGATSSFFSSVITTKSVVVCFKTHPEPGAGRVSSFISFTTRVLLRLMLYYAHLEQIVTQRLKMYVKVLLKLLFTRSEKDEALEY